MADFRLPRRGCKIEVQRLSNDAARLRLYDGDDKTLATLWLTNVEAGRLADELRTEEIITQPSRLEFYAEDALAEFPSEADELRAIADALEQYATALREAAGLAEPEGP
jgi:hypothetical protein